MGTWLKKRWDKGKMLSDLRPAIFLSLAACFMLFLFAPVEIYLGNQDEFWYDAYLLFPFLIKDFLFFLGVFLLGFTLAYLLGKRVYMGALYGVFTCFAAISREITGWEDFLPLTGRRFDGNCTVRRSGKTFSCGLGWPQWFWCCCLF